MLTIVLKCHQRAVMIAYLLKGYSLCACMCTQYCSNQDIKRCPYIALDCFSFYLWITLIFFQFVYWKRLAICHSFPLFSNCLSMVLYDMSLCSYITYILVVRFWSLIWFRFDFLARILQRTHCILQSGDAWYLVFSDF